MADVIIKTTATVSLNGVELEAMRALLSDFVINYMPADSPIEPHQAEILGDLHGKLLRRG